MAYILPCKRRHSAQTLSLQEYQSLDDKCPRLQTERSNTQDCCLRKKYPLIMLNPRKGTAERLYLQRNYCHNSYLILANILKGQTALLVEIFQKADYWFHSAFPSGTEGMSWEGEGKGQAVAVKARKSLYVTSPKDEMTSHHRDLYLLGGLECAYISFRAHEKYIHTSAELPNSLPSHTELSTASFNFSCAVSENDFQTHKFIVTDCKFCRNLSKGLAF